MPEDMKTFLMKSLRRQSVEMSLHPIDHDSILTLACSQPAPNNTALQHMETVLGADYEQFRSLCLAIVKNRSRNSLSLVDAMFALHEVDEGAYQQYLKWTKLLDKTGKFKKRNTKNNKDKEDNLNVRTNILFDQMKAGNKTNQAQKPKTKEPSDPFQAKVEAHATANSISFQKALVVLAESEPVEFAAYNKRVAKYTNAQTMVFQAEKESSDIREVETAIQYCMEINNLDRREALSLIQKEDPLLYSRHRVNIQMKYGRN